MLSPTALLYDCMTIVRQLLEFGRARAEMRFGCLYARQIYLTLYIKNLVDLFNSEPLLDRIVVLLAFCVYFIWPSKTYCIGHSITDRKDGCRIPFQELMSIVSVSQFYIIFSCILKLIFIFIPICNLIGGFLFATVVTWRVKLDILPSPCR